MKERDRLSWAESTSKTSRWVLHDFQRAAPKRVTEVRPKHVSKWLRSRRNGRIPKDTTLRTRLSIVRAWGDWLIDQRIVKANPTAGLTIRAERPAIPRAIPADAVPRLLEACPDERARAIVLLSLHLGLRRAELAGLRIGDIDIGRRQLVIRGKGGWTDVMPVPEEAWIALISYLAEHPASSGPLFRSFVTDEALKPAWIYRITATALYDSGIKTGPHDGMSLHSLRHRMVLDVLERTKDPQRARLASRHRSWAGFQAYTNVTLRTDDLTEILDGRRYRP
ncbi:MAG: tyrosine-type recombinase/integrase [Actinomycetota bacterium]